MEIKFDEKILVIFFLQKSGVAMAAVVVSLPSPLLHIPYGLNVDEAPGNIEIKVTLLL